MLSTDFTAKIFAALVLSSVCATASPPSGLIAERDEQDNGPLTVFGPSGKPEIAAIEAAMAYAFDPKNAAGMKDWLPIILGFHKCSKAWAPSLFNQDENTLVDGKALVKLFSPQDQQRDEQQIKADSMVRSGKLMPDVKWEDQKDKAWWPWALLEASQKYAVKDSELDFAQSIKVLSGFDAVTLEGAELEQRLKDEQSRKGLFDDVYSRVASSPVWLQYEQDGNYTVALDTVELLSHQGDSQSWHNITYFSFTGGKDEGQTDADLNKLRFWSSPLDHAPDALLPTRIIYLKDLPSFDVERLEWVK